MKLTKALPDGVKIKGPVDAQAAEILTPEAVQFVTKLAREFESTLLAARNTESSPAVEAAVRAFQRAAAEAIVKLVAAGDRRMRPPTSVLLMEITSPGPADSRSGSSPRR